MNWQDLLRDYGWPTFVLIVVVITGWREMWYFGPAVRNARKSANRFSEEAVERAITRGDEWRDLALSLLQQNRESLTIGQQIAQAIKGEKNRNG